MRHWVWTGILALGMGCVDASSVALPIGADAGVDLDESVARGDSDASTGDSSIRGDGGESRPSADSLPADQGDSLDGSVGEMDGQLLDGGTRDARMDLDAEGDGEVTSIADATHEDGAVDGLDARLTDAVLDRDAAPEPDAAPVPDAAVEPDAEPEDAAPDPDAAVPPPRCDAPSGVCPDVPVRGFEEGEGMAAIPECDYRLEDANQWAEMDALIDALGEELPVLGVDGILDDLNRESEGLGLIIRGRVNHLQRGFRWDDGDNDVRYWYPQGITGSADASARGTVDGRRVLAASWYFKVDRAPGDIEKGVRISFADVTDMGDVRYRHALLVEPYSDGGVPNFRPVLNHAGGIVWYRNWLYVADTHLGFRVFDMSRIMRVRTGQDRIGLQRASGEYDAFNYRYVIPQVNIYRLREDSCRAKFSFVALDRSTRPHSLLSGEYQVDRVDGRLLRWALDEETGRLEGTDDIPALEAYVAGHTRMQGALSWRGRYYLNCSSQFAVFGRLYRTGPGVESETFAGPDGPEDLYYDPTTERLWSHTEDEGDRNVYYSDLDDLD